MLIYIIYLLVLSGSKYLKKKNKQETTEGIK